MVVKDHRLNVRTKLSGALQTDFEVFQKTRGLGVSDAAQILITRGLDGYSRDTVNELADKNFTLTVQSLMILQRLITSIDPDQLELAREDSIKYLTKVKK